MDKPYKGSGKKWEMPTKDDNYHRTLQDKPWRNTLKPLNIDQPEGPSFQVLCTSRNPSFFSDAMQARPQPLQPLMHIGTSVCSNILLEGGLSPHRCPEPCCWVFITLIPQVDGNMVTWEKWHIRTSFNYREGLVLHNVG